MSLPVSEKALLINKQMADSLKKILLAKPSSPLEPLFTDNYNEFLSLFDLFQEEVFSFSGLDKVCRAGCGVCCCHWVDDVFSFEADRIMNRIISDSNIDLSVLRKIFQDDIEEITRLESIVAEKISDSSAAGIDAEEILLTAFYQLDRPCPLLASDGNCGIYPVRPVSCRAYVNLSDPVLCEPDRILESEQATYFLWPEDDCSLLLDELHELYARHGEPAAMRPLLLQRLESALQHKTFDI